MENVPSFIPPKRIKRAANKLLNLFSEQVGWQIQVPIPLDEIVRFIGYQLEYDNLEIRTGEPNVLGMIQFKTTGHWKGQIWIDESLANDASRLGQYNFTVGHELGHHALHGPESIQFVPQTNKPSHKVKQFTCQADQNRQNKAPSEKQADIFSAELFMPEDLIRKYFKEIALNYPASRFSNYQERITRELKTLFESSFQAMSYRLEKLNCWNEHLTI